ncbi:MAG TPA: helix-turn-helix transcriptional regulator [Acidimicrobiales bacterium]|nr:helix-turn-helix transcriptional regulator [Acidimicrobiales bacterium]
MAISTHQPRWYRIRDEASLGDAIAAVRKASGRSQEQLAARIGAERASIRRIEQGRLAVLGRIMKALGVCGYELIAVPRGTKVTVE